MPRAELSELGSGQSGIVSALFAAAAAAALGMSALILAENGLAIAAYGKLPLFIACCLALLALAALFLFVRLPGRAPFFVILAAGVLLRLALILSVQAPPVLDYALFYDAAQRLLTGDTSWTSEFYFVVYPNLIPVAYFYAGLFSICNSLPFAGLVNLAFMAGILALVYGLAKLVASRRAALITMLLYALYPASVLTAPQLTNQHASLFFMLLGLYLLLKYQTPAAAGAAGALIALGNLLRSEAVVLYAALAVFFVLLLIDAARARDARLIRARLARAVCLAAAIALSTALLAAAFAGVSPQAADNRSSYVWKLIVGFNDAESGTYSDADLYEYVETGDGAAIVSRLLREQDDWPDFFSRKTRAMWSSFEDPGFTFQAFDTTKRVDIGPLHTDVAGLIRRGQVFDKTLYTLVFALFLGSCCAVLMRKNARKPLATLLILIFCANFCAYLLIEVGARYRYFIMPFVFALSAVAIERLDAFCYARLRPRFAKDGKAKAARAEL